MAKTLHILNGDSLAEGIGSLQLKGTILVWREMLCAGPTSVEVGGEQFFRKRSEYLGEQYQISHDSYHNAFVTPMHELGAIRSFDTVHLWFEYDLFCHLNLLGALAWIYQHGFEGDIYHVCSGRIKGENRLFGLSELSPEQLEHHYSQKKLLTATDLELAQELWALYCEQDHNALIPRIVQTSSFDYLSNCLKSHIERFPDSRTGLNLLESHILKLIQSHTVKSEHQLCGYVLDRQGFYGYGDTQISKMITSLRPFFGKRQGVLHLNKKGEKVLQEKLNVIDIMENSVMFGGSKKYQWCYDAEANTLIPRT
ncbi:MAG: DUF1835 domain-containing protein [Bacteroidota bacterium]